MPPSSGTRIFDEQCHGGLIKGNVIGDAQLSWYIRPTHATECNGHVFAPGELLAADLKTFPNLPPDISRFIESLGRQVILNEIRHWTPPKSRPKKQIHGYIVTEGHDGGYRHIRTFYVRTSPRSMRIMAVATQALTGAERRES